MTASDAPEDKKTFENNVGKGKILVTSISSFSHNVFYPMKDEFNASSNIQFLSGNAFNFDKTNILSSGTVLTESYTKTVFFTPLQSIIQRKNNMGIVPFSSCF